MEKYLIFPCNGAGLTYSCVKEVVYVSSTDTVQSFPLDRTCLKQPANDNSPDALLMNLFITGAAKAKHMY